MNSVDPAAKTRVLVVDDHPVLRQGLEMLINGCDDLTVCGAAGDVPEALRLATLHRPQVVVTDVSLTTGDGIELTREIVGRMPDVAVLVLSIYDEAVYAERALRAGARGYLMKTAPPDQVMQAIRRVVTGGVHVSDGVAAKLLRRVSGGRGMQDKTGLDRLSDRELQILRAIGQGLSVREVAEQLFLSAKTIEAHRCHIKEKLGIATSGELRRYAIQVVRSES